MSGILTFQCIISAQDEWCWVTPSDSWHPGYTLLPSKTAATGYIMRRGDSTDPMVASAVAHDKENGSTSLGGYITADGRSAQVPIKRESGWFHDRYYFNLPGLGGQQCKIKTEDDSDKVVIVNKDTGNTLAWGDDHQWHVYENLGPAAIDQLAACLLTQTLVDGFFVSKELSPNNTPGESGVEGLNNGLELTNNVLSLANSIQGS